MIERECSECTDFGECEECEECGESDAESGITKSTWYSVEDVLDQERNVNYYYSIHDSHFKHINFVMNTIYSHIG